MQSLSLSHVTVRSKWIKLRKIQRRMYTRPTTSTSGRIRQVLVQITSIWKQTIIDWFLEHHCGVCQKPLHSRSWRVASMIIPLTFIDARAKFTCLGKHVEPCYRFHQQLHFLGKLLREYGWNPLYLLKPNKLPQERKTAFIIGTGR